MRRLVSLSATLVLVSFVLVSSYLCVMYEVARWIAMAVGALVAIVMLWCFVHYWLFGDE